MKVKELIKKLSKLPENALVVCCSDTEGNNYSPLDCIDYDKSFGYAPENSWSGYVALRKLTRERQDEGYVEDDINEDAVEAVFLIPEN